ncbi:sensor histidine kinase [Gordonia phthalatica]|uniref:Oxygen sensor histidine kinase NreB n=1 Tax=Gordonia phthalatica TaxID=1136941 RepID=A0A0N9MN06_9ACTN|nr:sensor histidine kinase [Gordonia phthalatica]ALG84106.1 histidine kinase [Gordonia phthalatica]
MTHDRATDRNAEWGGHVLFAILLAVGVVKSSTEPHAVVSLIGAALVAGWYLVGAVASARGHRDRAGLWVLVLTAGWAGLVAVSDDYVWLAFVLAILCWRFLRRPPAVVAAVTITVVSVVGVWATEGFTVGGVIGPTIGIATAVAVTEAFERITRTVEERDRLLDELVQTRDELAEREREAGVLAERDRLGGEIHDGVGQYLTSIIMLLRADQPDAALTAAQAALSESRRFLKGIDAPVPADGVSAALARQTVASSAEGLPTAFAEHGARIDLPDDVQLALLRITQEALLNARRHAAASTATVTLTHLPGEVHLDVVDDGIGIPADRAGSGFGLRSMRSRVAQCRGEFTVDATPGGGTTIHARLPVGGRR